MKHLILLVVPFFAGCVTFSVEQLQQLSAGHVGCPPGEIVVTENQGPTKLTTWKAECDGKTFYCTSSWTKDAKTSDCKERSKKKKKPKQKPEVMDEENPNTAP